MECNDEYNALINATEKLHELYYQQENVNEQFFSARNETQNNLVSLGFERLVTASAAEIIYSLEQNLQNELVILYDASIAKVQTDKVILEFEESYGCALERYEKCVKKNLELKNL